MTVAEGCLLFAALMPIIAVGLAKAQPGYDNANPRAFLSTLTGWRARAVALQVNCFEALPLITAGILLAQWHRVPQARIDAFALAYVLTRLAYAGAYLAGRATLRSILWTAATAIAVGLFLLQP